ncbi:alpha/beta hydrolase family protein [Nocardioides bruguierae]|uniref:Prolyl oligopeptidase family serine peptidase n=1 Tax=Nocardioides bruguierae TaxID=2945102 RepID=A0A9X2D6A0_9ACTN|nr:prolyl oligopeptidase family serine peptidase [Nocardioides bruguierae]MCM0619850.1 prolyl oligopeptidase family serine peptidase [Nocardioides bruguierae]
MTRTPLAAALAALALVLTACTGGTQEDAGGAAAPASSSAPAPSEPSTSSGSPTRTASPSESGSGSASADETVAAEDLPRVERKVSLPALMRDGVRSGRLTRTQPLASTDTWRSWAVTYRVEDRTVSGELLVPRGRGPFPAVVLNHGYIEPSYYSLGQGLSREQEYLAARGFVVLHTDYGGYAGSDPVGKVGWESRLAWTRDAIGAVQEVKKMAVVDEDRTAFLGRSAGGGVTYNAIVADPDLVDAAVVFAPVSSDLTDNLARWTVPERPDFAAALAQAVGGTPAQEPRAYRQLSPRTYFDRIEVPVLIHHGTSDDVCPIGWSRTTQRLLERAGVRSRLVEYAGEEHAFGPQFTDSMARTVRFLRARLDG